MPELVIADDLSGAAEIAGIAARSGRSVRLCTRVPAQPPDADVVIIDTNTRLMSPECAAGEIRRVCASVAGWPISGLYKKIDSVMRGPVAAELAAALTGFQLRRAVLVPANVSRGRTISGGECLIHGVPLHLSPFADDPVHPARPFTCLMPPLRRISIPSPPYCSRAIWRPGLPIFTLLSPRHRTSCARQPFLQDGGCGCAAVRRRLPRVSAISTPGAFGL
jgi:hypothetical protein